MKQTEIGLIPDDWEVKKLGEISDLLTGYPFPGNDIKTNGTYRLLRGINITEGEIRHSQDIDRYYSGDISQLKKYLLQENDLVIGMDGSKVGKNSAIISKSNSNSLLVQRVARLRHIKKLSSIDYISQFINSYFFTNYVDSLKTNSAIPHISPANIRNFIIPFPSLTEQHRIAKALSDVDALISTIEKLIQKKKNIKQGTMQNLLTGKKRLPGFAKSTEYKQTELGLIPEDWEVKKLSDFGTFSKGSGISREESNTGEIPAVRYGELYTTHNDYIKSFYSHISDEVASKSKKLKKGDLLFTCSGETKEDIGKCVAFIGNEKAYAGGDLLILSPTINIDSLFYGFLLNTNVAIKQKSSMAQGDAVVHISAESIGKVQVPFPSKKEQNAIANVLSSMDKEIETLNTKLEKYRNIKTAMMQQLLTGKIRLVK